MPAAFASELCGFRPASGHPNTSDASDPLSIEIGQALFQQLGVAEGSPAPANIGALLSERVSAALDGLRPNIRLQTDVKASAYAQYLHLQGPHDLRAFTLGKIEQSVRKTKQALDDEHLKRPLGRQSRARLANWLAKVDASVAATGEQLTELTSQLIVESVLKIDVAVARQGAADLPPELLAALSLKWSLRTDRAQDPLSQGAKLASTRRGFMPHFAVVTMEPRPAMLALLADGTGGIDRIYHLALPQLEAALNRLAQQPGRSTRWRPLRTFERLRSQGRLVDFDDLVAFVRAA